MADYIIVDGELKHYGVVGMKWGQRKARQKGVNYAYRSHGQKKWQRKLAKAKSTGADAQKVAKAKQKLDLYKQRDKNRQAYASKTKTGSAVARTLLLGGFGAGSYNRMRAAGHNRLASAAVGYILGNVPGIGYGITRHIETRAAKRDLNAKKRRK